MWSTKAQVRAAAKLAGAGAKLVGDAVDGAPTVAKPKHAAAPLRVIPLAFLADAEQQGGFGDVDDDGQGCHDGRNQKADLRLAVKEEIEHRIERAVERTFGRLTGSLLKVEVTSVQTAHQLGEVRNELVQTSADVAGLRTAMESSTAEVAKPSARPAPSPQESAMVQPSSSHADAGRGVSGQPQIHQMHTPRGRVNDERGVLIIWPKMSSDQYKAATHISPDVRG